MVLSKELLDVLACPKCKGSVSVRGMFIACGKCRLAYPVLGGDVPDMLIEDAWPLARAKKADFRHKEKL